MLSEGPVGHEKRRAVAHEGNITSVKGIVRIRQSAPHIRKEKDGVTHERDRRER
jgi:hypothetical protein